MGYKQFLRSQEAAGRRQEREALRRHRELLKHAKHQQKEMARERAEEEVELFESYLVVLVSVHKDCGDIWDWNALSKAPSPTAPMPTQKKEAAARQQVVNYHPGFFERLFGKAKKREAELQTAVERAVVDDSNDHLAAVSTHRDNVALWEIRREIGHSVVNKNVAAYKKAFAHVDPFYELTEFKTRVVVSAMESDVIALSCILEDEELVPKEELKLTAGKKVTTKEMAAARYWALQQDYVCSCALRAARETFAVLPVSRVIVNVQATRLDKSTGHDGLVTLLAIHFTRQALERVNMDAVDPSDSLKNFQYRMKFKKSAGFEPVDLITTDEQWVTA